jgi:hypothetical protein
MATTQETQLQRDNSVRISIAFALNHAIDCDAHRGITIDEVKQRIRDGSIWVFLREKLPDFDPWALSAQLGGAAHAETIRLEWDSMINALDSKDERLGLLVQNNGICLLLSYLFNGQNRPLQP